MIGQRPYGYGSLFRGPRTASGRPAGDRARRRDGSDSGGQCAGRSRAIVLAALRQARIDLATSAVPVPQGLTVGTSLRRSLEDVARPPSVRRRRRDYDTAFAGT